MAHNHPENNPIGVGNEPKDYFNFEGMDSEMVIPAGRCSPPSPSSDLMTDRLRLFVLFPFLTLGETDGLPSLRARRNAARKQKAKPKAFTQRLKGMFGGSGDSNTSGAQDPEKNADVSADSHDINGGDISTDEEDDYGRPGGTQEPFSVLGNLLALRDADQSGSSTAASSTTSLEQYDENGNRVKTPKSNEQSLNEKDIGKESLTAPSTGLSAPPTPKPEGAPGYDPSPKYNKSSNSLFSLKGHPAFLDKPGKYFTTATSAAQSALSTPGGMAKSVAKNFKSDAAAAKKRRREKKKDLIKAKLAAVIERQSFIMKLTRALMMFGSPSHRLEALITNTGTFLEGALFSSLHPGRKTSFGSLYNHFISTFAMCLHSRCHDNELH